MAKRRNRLIYGGGGVLILGIILGQFIGLTPGINSGPGAGTEKKSSDESTKTALASTESDLVPVLIQPEPEKDKAASESPLKVLDILIDNRSYFVKAHTQAQTSYRPAEIEEIIQLAKQATGDEDGIQVRVYRKGSARVIPETLLKEELNKSGLPSEKIDWKIHLVE